MKGLVKWLCIGVAALVVLLAAVVIAVPMLVDVQQYKPKIEELVTRQTGRSFSMGDDIDLSVFPWVGVSLSDLHLGNAKGFQAKDMISVKGFEVRLKVMPLLSKQIVVDTFVVDTPEIFLEKRKDGKTNWEDLAKPGGTAELKADKAPGQSSGQLPVESLMVGNFAIKNGLVSYADKAGGMKKDLSDFNLSLSDISFDRPVGISLSARLDGKPVSLEGRVGPVGKEPGKSDLDFDLTVKLLAMLDLDLAGTLKDPQGSQQADLTLAAAPFSPRKLMAELGLPFPVETADPKALDKIGLAATVSAGPKAVSVSKGELILDDSTLGFTAAAKTFEKPDITFDLKLDQIDLDRYLPPKKAGETAADKNVAKSEKPGSGKKEQADLAALQKLVLDGKIAVGSLKTSDMNVSDVEVRVTGKGGVFKLSPFAAKLDGKPVSLKGRVGLTGKKPNLDFDLAVKLLSQMTLDLKGKVTDLQGSQQADLTLAVSAFSPRKFMAELDRPFPVETADPKVLDKVALSAAVSASPKKVSIKKGNLVLDDSSLKFTLAARDFEKPDIAFDLSLDKIDLDRYLPPKKAGEKDDNKGAAKSEKSESGETSQIDYGPLRKLVLDGKVAAGSLKAANLSVSNLVARVKGKGGVFTLDPLSMNLYDGSIGATAGLDVRKNAPKSSVKLDVKNVQAGPLIRDAAAKDIIEGTLVAAMNLAMTGDTPEAVKKSLKGNGEMTFQDGAIVGIDIADTVRNAASKVGMSEKPDAKPKTDFAELKIPFTAANGNANIPGASMMSPLLRLKAAGDAHLVKETLDFRVEPKLVATLKGQGDTKDRSGLMVPLLVTGTFADPKIRPDLAGMVKGGIPDTEQLKEMAESQLKGLQLPGTGSDKSGTGSSDTGSSGTETKSVEDQAKGLLKGLLKN